MKPTIILGAGGLATAALLFAACGGGTGKPFVEGPGPKDESRIGGLLGGGEEPEVPQSTGSNTTTGSAGGTDPGMGTCGFDPTDTCGGCALDMCPSEVAACVSDSECCCLFECVDNGGDPNACVEDCGGNVPMPLLDLQTCTGSACSAECGGA